MDVTKILTLCDLEKKELLKETEQLLVKSQINYSFTYSKEYGVITGIGLPDGVNNTGYKETDLLLQFLLLKKLTT